MGSKSNRRCLVCVFREVWVVGRVGVGVLKASDLMFGYVRTEVVVFGVPVGSGASELLTGEVVELVLLPLSGSCVWLLGDERVRRGGVGDGWEMKRWL